MLVTEAFIAPTFASYLRGITLCENEADEANDEYLSTLSTKSRAVYQRELQAVLEKLSEIRKLAAKNKEVIEDLKTSTQQTLSYLQMHREHQVS